MTSVFAVEFLDPYEGYVCGYYSTREIAEEMRVKYHHDVSNSYGVVEHPLDEWVDEVRANHVMLTVLLRRDGTRVRWEATSPRPIMMDTPHIWRAYPGPPFDCALLLCTCLIAANEETAANMIAEHNRAFEAAGLWERAERELKSGERLGLETKGTVR